MKYLEQIKSIVDQYYKTIDSEWVISHFERTLYWLIILKPDADEAIKVAAYGHDIERAIPEDKIQESKDSGSYLNTDKLEYHQVRSAELLSEELRKLDAPEDMIERVYSLVRFHEVGGDKDQNILQAADSISFLENNIDHFIFEKQQERGYEKIRDKFDWMYQRIQIKKAQDIAYPLYQKAIKLLEKNKISS